MAVTDATKRLVWLRAGGKCAFADCRRDLVEHAANEESDVQIGEVAHIVAQSVSAGPRSDNPVPGGDRDGVSNLVLLRPTCHAIVDRQPATYTVERLVGIKQSHEQWVRDRLCVEARKPVVRVHEDVHSSLLAVDKMSRYVYTTPCNIDDAAVRQLIRWPLDKSILLPFFIQDKLLITFSPLTEPHGPFAEVILREGAAERHLATEWWADPVLSGWYVTLLNRALNKLTGRRGLNLDKAHRRYYFEPVTEEVPSADSESQSEPAVIAKPRRVRYRPLSTDESEVLVAWQPKKRSTGELRPYWKHRAIALRFHRVSPDQWVLSLRPEHRFTRDGFTPLPPKMTGKRSTGAKAHMYNVDLIAELQFWRNYLSDGSPFITMSFGQEHLVIDAHLLAGGIEWPGVAGDTVAFKNARTDFDLFTSAAYFAALEAGLDEDDELEGESGISDADVDDWETEEIEAMTEYDSDGDQSVGRKRNEETV